MLNTKKAPRQKYTLFVRIDPLLGEKLGQKAIADRRSITATVEMILEQHFKVKTT
jgi:hypothetical protein